MLPVWGFNESNLDLICMLIKMGKIYKQLPKKKRKKMRVFKSYLFNFEIKKGDNESYVATVG